MAQRRGKGALKIVAFDMDGTIIDGRVIYALGQKFGFTSEIRKITKSSRFPYLRSERIARLLSGRQASEVAATVEKTPLTKGSIQTMRKLKEMKFKIGVISDSYTLATEIVARKLDMDFTIANRLEVKNGVITGVLRMPMGWEKIDCSCNQSVCKRYALARVARRYHADLSQSVAVGDSSSDLCMIRNAGLGIWFNPSESVPIGKGENVIRSGDMRLILKHLMS